jgi:hypothetical protein
MNNKTITFYQRLGKSTVTQQQQTLGAQLLKNLTKNMLTLEG